MVARAYSPRYSGGWGRKISWTREMEVAVSLPLHSSRVTAWDYISKQTNKQTKNENKNKKTYLHISWLKTTTPLLGSHFYMSESQKYSGGWFFSTSSAINWGQLVLKEQLPTWLLHSQVWNFNSPWPFCFYHSLSPPSPLHMGLGVSSHTY